MPSQRNNLGENNINDSKNTRMDFTKQPSNMNYRKDEIMHIGRYWNGVETILELSKNLGRPIKVLDIGCGEMNTAKMLNSAVFCKKEDVLAEYIGVDIDSIMVKKACTAYGQSYKTLNARFHIQDLTVDSKLPFEDGHFDLVICFEFMEHIQPKFLPAILAEARRLLGKNGKALFSTPNSNGSNEKLPKDHIYEYSFEECLTLFDQAGFKVTDAMGTCVNIIKMPKEEKERLDQILKRFYSAFGRGSAFSAVAIAPLFNPKYCKNVIYHLSR